jgi:hypothetical protein
LIFFWELNIGVEFAGIVVVIVDIAVEVAGNIVFVEQVELAGNIGFVVRTELAYEFGSNHIFDR